MVRYVCAKCEKESEAMQCCAGCKMKYYCSRQCQRADWKRHRPECAAGRALPVELNARVCSAMVDCFVRWAFAARHDSLRNKSFSDILSLQFVGSDAEATQLIVNPDTLMRRMYAAVSYATIQHADVVFIQTGAQLPQPDPLIESGFFADAAFPYKHATTPPPHAPGTLRVALCAWCAKRGHAYVQVIVVRNMQQ